MANVKFQVEGFNKLQKDLEKLQKVPQKHISAAAKKGMNIAYKQAKANAPYDTGNLKKGMILVGEKSKEKAKKVYRVVFDRSMNDVFQKKNASGKITGYYPISQEYGFFTKNGRYIPGYRFIHDSLNQNVKQIGDTMIEDLKTKIDAELAKAGLK